MADQDDIRLAVSGLNDYKKFVAKTTDAHSRGSYPMKKAPYKNAQKCFKNFGKASYPYAPPIGLDLKPKRYKTAEKYISSMAAAGLTITVQVLSDDGSILLYDFEPSDSAGAISMVKENVTKYEQTGMCPICNSQVTTASPLASHYKYHVFAKYYTAKTGTVVYGSDYGVACSASLQPIMYGLSDIVTIGPDNVTCHACPDITVVPQKANVQGSKNLVSVISHLESSAWDKDLIIPVDTAKENPLMVALTHVLVHHYHFYCCLLHNMFNGELVPVHDQQSMDIHLLQEQLRVCWLDAYANMAFGDLVTGYERMISRYVHIFTTKSLGKLNIKLLKLKKPAIILAGREAQILPPPDYTPEEAQVATQQMEVDVAAATVIQTAVKAKQPGTKRKITTQMGALPSSSEMVDPGASTSGTQKKKKTSPAPEFVMPTVVGSATPSAGSATDVEMMPPPASAPSSRKKGKSRPTAKSVFESGPATQKKKDKKKKKQASEDDVDTSAEDAADSGAVQTDDIVTADARSGLLAAAMTESAQRSFLDMYPFDTSMYNVYHDGWPNSVYNVTAEAFKINTLGVLKATGKDNTHIVIIETKRAVAASVLSYVAGVCSKEAMSQQANTDGTKEKCWFPVVTSASVAPGGQANTIRLLFTVEHPTGYVTVSSIAASGKQFSGSLKRKLPYCMLQGMYDMAEGGRVPYGPINLDCFLTSANPEGSGHCISLLPFIYAPLGVATSNVLAGTLDCFYLVAACMQGLSQKFIATKVNYSDTDLPPDRVLNHPNLVKLKALFLSRYSKTAGEQVLNMNFPPGMIPITLEFDHIATVRGVVPWVVSGNSKSPKQRTQEKINLWIGMITDMLEERPTEEEEAIIPQPMSRAIIFEDYSMVSNAFNEPAARLADVAEVTPEPAPVAGPSGQQQPPAAPAPEVRLDIEDSDYEDEVMAATGATRRGRKKKKTLSDDHYETQKGPKIGPGTDVKRTGKFSAAVEILPAGVRQQAEAGALQTTAMAVLDTSVSAKAVLQTKVTAKASATKRRIALSGAGYYGMYNSVPYIPRTAFQYRTVIKGPARNTYDWDYDMYKTTPDLTVAPRQAGNYQVYIMWLKNDKSGKGPHNFFSSRSVTTYTPRFGIPDMKDLITLGSTSLIKTKSVWIKRFKVANVNGMLPSRYKQFIKQYSEICQAASRFVLRKHFTRHFVTFFDTPKRTTSSMNAVSIIEPLGSYDLSSIDSIGSVVAGGNNTAVMSHVTGIIKCVLRAAVVSFRSTRYLFSNVLPGYIWYNHKRNCYVFDIIQAMCDSIFFSSSIILAMHSLTGFCTSFAETLIKIGVHNLLDPTLKDQVTQLADSGAPVGGWPVQCKTISEKLRHLCVIFGLVPADSTDDVDMGGKAVVPQILIPNTLGTEVLALVAPAFIYMSKTRFAWETAVVTIPVVDDTFYGKNKEATELLTQYHSMRMHEDEKTDGLETDAEKKEADDIIKNRAQWIINPNIPPTGVVRKKPDSQPATAVTQPQVPEAMDVMASTSGAAEPELLTQADMAFLEKELVTYITPQPMPVQPYPIIPPVDYNTPQQFQPPPQVMQMMPPPPPPLPPQPQYTPQPTPPPPFYTAAPPPSPLLTTTPLPGYTSPPQVTLPQQPPSLPRQSPPQQSPPQVIQPPSFPSPRGLGAGTKRIALKTVMTGEQLAALKTATGPQFGDDKSSSDSDSD